MFPRHGGQSTTQEPHARRSVGPPPLRLVAPGELLPEPLSEREQEVLRLVAIGSPNREIATALCITESTVKTHLQHIFAKLAARNRTEAVAIARKHCLIDR